MNNNGEERREGAEGKEGTTRVAGKREDGKSYKGWGKGGVKGGGGKMDMAHGKSSDT